MAHLITPMTLQGEAGYDHTYVDEVYFTGYYFGVAVPVTWDYADPFTVCCSAQQLGVNPTPGVTPRLYQSLGHDDNTDVTAYFGTVGPGGSDYSGLVATVLNTTDVLGTVCAGSVRYGICCAQYAYLTMFGQMRSQAAYEGDDWCEVWLNGVKVWGHSASNSEGREWWEDLTSDPDDADNDFAVYQYVEMITLTLDTTRACGNLIEIKSSTESATISQAELDASPGSGWNGVFWHCILTGGPF